MGIISGVNAVNDGLIFSIDAGNQYCYPKFTTGTVCGTANESLSLTLTAPTGAFFDQINYASYGTPNGTCGLYSNGSCHSAISQTTCELYFLNQSTATIPATNGVFGDSDLDSLYVTSEDGKLFRATKTGYKGHPRF